MGHILKKRTNYNYGSFKLDYNKFNLQSCLHGYYLPSKLYMQFQLPYYYPNKTTILQWKYYNYVNKKYWLDYL